MHLLHPGRATPDRGKTELIIAYWIAVAHKPEVLVSTMFAASL